MKKTFQFLQNIGKSLMFPIAVLPVAALLLRLGQDDIAAVFGILPGEDGKTVFSAIAAAGGAIFGNLGIIFAIGVGIGFSKKYKEAAALSAIVGFFIMGAVLVSFGVFKDLAAVQHEFIIGGIGIGILAGYMADIAVKVVMPKFLGFFSGRRLAPILTGLLSLVIGYLFVEIWPPIQTGIDNLGTSIVESGNAGLFGYALLNRILLVTGLHNILNALVWFNFGEFTNSAGELVKGDLNRFFAGDKTAGSFMTGFYPIMMFGLPAVATAIILRAKKERRQEIAGTMLSVGFTSFLTGITEPMEYSFMFIAPALYGVHALLTGCSMVIVNILGIKHGFGFSAGLIDYLLNMKYATNGWLLIPVGLAFFLVYFVIFYYAIEWFNIKTPGREDDEDLETSATKSVKISTKKGSKEDRAKEFLDALGGFENLKDIDACVTRLRLEVVNVESVDKDRLKQLSGKAIVTPTKSAIQVILGSEAEVISDTLNGMKGR